MKKYIWVMLLIIVSSLSGVVLEYSVIASGYQYSSNSEVYHQGAIGQVATEVISNASYTLRGGFWQPLDRPLDSGIQGMVSLVTHNATGGLITDVSITVGGVTVNPDINGFFSVVLAPGIYSLAVTLTGYNPVEVSGLEVTGTGYTQRNITLTDWRPISGTQYSMLMLSSVVQGNIPLAGENGNLLAAFGPGGDQDCRGVGMWIPDLGIYYMDIVGNNAGEVISFRFLDQDLGQVLNCTETLSFFDNSLIGAFDNPFLLHLITVSISNLSIHTSENNIVLAWDGPDGVDYHIYRSSIPYSGFINIGTVQVPTFTDVNALVNTRAYYYRITFEQ